MIICSSRNSQPLLKELRPATCVQIYSRLERSILVYSLNRPFHACLLQMKSSSQLRAQRDCAVTNWRHKHTMQWQQTPTCTSSARCWLCPGAWRVAWRSAPCTSGRRPPAACPAPGCAPPGPLCAAPGWPPAPPASPSPWLRSAGRNITLCLDGLSEKLQLRLNSCGGKQRPWHDRERYQIAHI